MTPKSDKQANIIMGRLVASFGDFAVYEAEGREQPYSVWRGRELFSFYHGRHAAEQYARLKAGGGSPWPEAPGEGTP